MTTPRLYTYDEAAAVLRMSKVWLSKQVQAGRVPCRRAGRSVRFSDDDLNAIVAQLAQPAVNGPQR